MSDRRVTVVIPTLDEAAAIEECLDRVCRQTWGDLQVLVADGGSADGTRDAVGRIAAADRRIELVDNPGRIQSAGLNAALARAEGDVVVRLDARSFVADDYVARCVELLERTGAAVVGGRMVARAGGSTVARGIALANGAWWGAGPAGFHGAGEAGPAETVYLGSFRHAWLEKVGGWATDVGVNEDYELNHRIRAEGGLVWLDPGLEVGYQARTTFAALARQYVRYGRSKSVVMRRHPSSVKLRQVAPLALVAAGGAAALPGPVGRSARGAVAAHAALVAVLAWRAPAPAGVRAAAAVAALTMHWSWSAGAWLGAWRGVSGMAGPASTGARR